MTATVFPFDPRAASNAEMWARKGLPPVAWASRDDLLRGSAMPVGKMISGSQYGGDIFPASPYGIK